MSEMVERVARALCIERGFPPDDKYRSSRHEGCEPREFQWHAFQPEARAAIEAMREPTKAMSDAVESLVYSYYGGGEPIERYIFQGMIDAALK